MTVILKDVGSTIPVEMKACPRCQLSKDVNQFKWKKDPRYRAGGTRASVCGSCQGLRYRTNRNSDPVRAAKYRAYHAIRSKTHQLENKVKAYRQGDSRRGVMSITLTEARNLIIGSQCHYCGESETIKLGLDRLDNALGHSIENVRVCCELCNNILSDLPLAAKDVIGKSLREIHELGLLSGYILKTKRNKKRKT